MFGGKILETNARLKILLNSESNPPIPKSSKLKLGLIMLWAADFEEPLSLMEESLALVN